MIPVKHTDIERNAMVKEVVRDILFLGQKSDEATEEDKQVIIDLHDTLEANRNQ